MDDSRIPWWLVVLLGIGVTGLAVWQSSRWKLQVRLGAGALALVYLALLVIAVGGDPRGIAAAQSWRLADLLVTGLGGVALTSAVLLSGRPALRGQLIWFGLLSLANAGICLARGVTGIATILAMTAAAALVLLVRECRSGAPLSISELWPASPQEPGDKSPDLSWLAGVTGLVLAVALIGTTYHALHAESTRAMTTRRHSAFPSRARIQNVLDIHSDEERSVSVMDLTFARRADVVVLLAALAFVSLASTMSTSRPPTKVLLSEATAGTGPGPAHQSMP